MKVRFKAAKKMKKYNVTNDKKTRRVKSRQFKRKKNRIHTTDDVAEQRA